MIEITLDKWYIEELEKIKEENELDTIEQAIKYLINEYNNSD